MVIGEAVPVTMTHRGTLELDANTINSQSKIRMMSKANYKPDNTLIVKQRTS